jgi:putative ABC transport system permease protein
MSAAGGIIGVFTGILSSAVVGKLFGWTVPVMPSGIALALSSSVILGVASGFYPAHGASLLNLVDALRFE